MNTDETAKEGGQVTRSNILLHCKGWRGDAGEMLGSGKAKDVKHGGETC